MRIPETLYNLADCFSQEKHIERADIFRRWMYESAEREAVRAVSDGTLSIERAVERLDTTYFDFYNPAQKYGVEVGSTVEQFRESLKNATLLRDMEHSQKSQEKCDSAN